MFLQVMITIPLILFLCKVFRSEIGFDSPNQQLDKHDERKDFDEDKPDGPLTPPNANDNAAWYYSKKIWGCVMIVGLLSAVIVYY